ncbi:hypothetical protein J1TS3_33960 [Siminovitchia fordii]|uniref:Uncharacterized protein n=1 Tax=Siminovitchia fordii TaxID=254759 RepID=A0ABQ4KAL5_9BACI|nr:hypothetical protein J1TS3_33960 [Siminovitchia fordii]
MSPYKFLTKKFVTRLEADNAFPTLEQGLPGDKVFPWMVEASFLPLTVPGITFIIWNNQKTITQEVG